MKSTYHIIKDDLLRADTLYKMNMVMKKIENIWFDISGRIEIEVMSNKKVTKWHNLYDEACSKYILIKNRRVYGTMDFEWIP